MVKAKLAAFVVLALLLSLVVPRISFALIDASVPPKGCFLLRLISEIHAASNWFDDTAMAVGFNDVSKLTHVDTQLELNYSFTGSIMTGLKFPIDYIRECHISKEKHVTTEMSNPWLTLQHQFLSKPFDCAYSISAKLPVVEIEPIAISVVDSSKRTVVALFHIDDKQIDIYPILYLDWQSSLGPYIYSKVGYKYRMDNDQTKPGNELRFAIETGFHVVPGVRIFACSDYTRFYKGEFNGKLLKAGYVHSLKGGIKSRISRNFRVEILTEADPWGKNQFQWVGGHVGIAYTSGDY